MSDFYTLGLEPCLPDHSRAMALRRLEACTFSNFPPSRRGVGVGPYGPEAACLPRHSPALTDDDGSTFRIPETLDHFFYKLLDIGFNTQNRF